MPRRAAERYRESPVDAVIFDTDGQGAESIEAFLDMHEKAHEEGQQLLAVVLLGPRQGALREKLPTDDKLIVLSKPIKMKQVQDALAQLLPPSSELVTPARGRQHAHQSARSICLVLMLGCTDGPPETVAAGSQGRRVPEPVKFLAGRGRTIATPVTTTAMRPGHSIDASRAGLPRPRGCPGRHDALADPAGGLGS